ncbi:MAG: hypothetical protein Q4P71_07740 [Actinomycetaceae bacterium]|nr:hypothetical protein [Actinomycetaceae bacterium]
MDPMIFVAAIPLLVAVSGVWMYLRYSKKADRQAEEEKDARTYDRRPRL